MKMTPGELLAWKAFPYWQVAAVWNERDRHATWKDEVKPKRKPRPLKGGEHGDDD